MTQPLAEPLLPSRQELIQICVTIMELRMAGDWAGLAAFFTEDMEMNIPGVPGLTPFSGVVRGRDLCIQAIRRNFTTIECVDLVPLHFILEGDCIALTWASGIRNRGTGPLGQVNGVARLRFRGRQIYYYSNHFDTAAVAALANLTISEA